MIYYAGEVFKCFSLQRTVEALLNTTTKEGQILCMNGIRVLSINWVVLGHVYYIGLGAAGDDIITVLDILS